MNNKCTNEIKCNLDKVIQENTISNAYIFYGPENVGKKEIALRFIAEIIKTNDSDFDTYKKIKNNNYADFLKIEPTFISKGSLINQSEISKEKNQTTKSLIRIEQIRKIKVFLGKKSIRTTKKFILIEDAHLLNESASNCLLKTLEEPTNGVFILLTSKLNLLKDTIISRCQIIRFKPYSDKKLKQLLEQSKHITQNLLSDSEVLETLIFISNGSPGKLLDNLEIWNQIPENIKHDIKFPLGSYGNILFLANNITSHLDLNEQEFLLNFMQRDWWQRTKDKKIVDILENIKINIDSKIQPRLSWEVGLLKLKLEDS